MFTIAEPPPIHEPPKPRSITYANTRWDLFTNYFTIFFRNRTLLGFVVCAMFLSASLSVLTTDHDGTPLMVRLLVILIIMFMGCVIMLVLQAILGGLMVLRRDPSVLAVHTLEITEQGSVERTMVNDSLWKWEGVRRVISNSWYLYIYVSLSQFHQVPKRNFQAEEINAFEQEVRSRMKPL